MNKNLEKFLRKRKRAIKGPEKYKNIFEDNIVRITHYIEHGKTQGEEFSNERLPFAPWEKLNIELSGQCKIYENIAQASLVKDSVIDAEHLSYYLNYGYYELAIAHIKQKRCFIRFGVENEGVISPGSVFQLATAFLLHQYDYARQFYRLFENGYMKNWINRSKSHIGDFIILLFDRAKGDNTLKPIVDDFAYQAILDNWNSTDLTKVTAYLNQLCDDQVTQVASPPSKMFFEFDNMNWQFTPYAALMLLTLRAQHGLENPDFDHPGFGNVTSLLLTQPVAPQKDEVLEQLVAKLHEQGFNEKALLA
ncbi:MULTISPECIES: hypothetical protein [unclassified Pseudoalteromonas]|uniref:hypothetical protein n=1 Tax=unclassified Pseudoalteromonas TaxID=194690 RepID=UPI00110A6F09|nr:MULTISPECIES: hypothetical protein [unclassified Pseudoalteromonas]MCF2915113.1 hypothetical protein [Pseudoalteromonas sp. Cn5-37]TMP48040.1 hypothetical protein CWB80_04365 [Pseudoalteromonas sp. S1650]TMP66251.1 hypothetical protein CWB79_12100 [Pseudoalteromonas sp. S1649]